MNVNVTPERLSTSDEILSNAERLTNYANDLVNRMAVKLATVMHPSPPTGPESCNTETPIRAMPPLLDNLRDEFARNRNALDAISAMLDRVDL